MSNADNEDLPTEYKWVTSIETITVEENIVLEWIFRKMIGRDGLPGMTLLLEPPNDEQTTVIRGEPYQPPRATERDGSELSDGAILLAPLQFVSKEYEDLVNMDAPERSEAKNAAAEIHGDDPPSEAIDRAHRSMIELYFGELRSKLKDEIDVITDDTHAHYVAVEYEQDDDETVKELVEDLTPRSEYREQLE